jgi:hypothetical protein
MLGGLSVLQAAVPAAIAVLSGLISFFRVHGRTSRLRGQIKETLELSKLADEAKSEQAKKCSDSIALAQLERLQAMDQRAANRTYDKQSLGVVVFLLLVGVPLAWALTLPGWIVTTVFAWIMTVFLLIFVPFGIAQFFAGGKIGRKKAG